MKRDVERTIKSAVDALNVLIKKSDEEEIKLGEIRNELEITLAYLEDVEDELCYCPVDYEAK